MNVCPSPARSSNPYGQFVSPVVSIATTSVRGGAVRGATQVWADATAGPRSSAAPRSQPAEVQLVRMSRWNADMRETSTWGREVDHPGAPRCTEGDCARLADPHDGRRLRARDQEGG